jgi:hypothetical protein
MIGAVGDDFLGSLAAMLAMIGTHRSRRENAKVGSGVVVRRGTIQYSRGKSD